MIKIIVPAHDEQVKRLVLEYQYKDMPTAGFYFDYTDGKPVFQCLEAAKNYKWCREHPDMVVDKGLKTIRHQSRVPAYVECECGERFYLIDRYYGCCQCSGCSLWYSILGEEMVPPTQWEEDLEPYE